MPEIPILNGKTNAVVRILSTLAALIGLALGGLAYIHSQGNDLRKEMKASCASRDSFEMIREELRAIRMEQRTDTQSLRSEFRAEIRELGRRIDEKNGD